MWPLGRSNQHLLGHWADPTTISWATGQFQKEVFEFLISCSWEGLVCSIKSGFVPVDTMICAGLQAPTLRYLSLT